MNGAGGDIGVYILGWAFVSAILLLVGLPVWFWKEFQSLHRTVRFLREDIELQQVEIKEL